MQNIAIKIFTTLVVFLNVTIIVAQTGGAVLKQDSTSTESLNKNTIVFSGILAHYEDVSKYGDTHNVIGYYQYPVDPGIEILFFRKLKNGISLGTGICYQKGRTMDFIRNQYRFHFAEVSIPILFSSHFDFDKRNGLIITTGVYGGKTIFLKAEGYGKFGGWYEIPDSDIGLYPDYSDDVFFMDIYFGAGYFYSFTQNRIVSITPFVKYRVNTVWLNSFQKELHYGVKLSYSFSY